MKIHEVANSGAAKYMIRRGASAIKKTRQRVKH
jgi:hypothetical protein